MKKFLFLIVVLLSGITMFAQPRSEQQAKQIASEFFKKKPQRKAAMLSVVPQQKVSQTITRRMTRAKTAPAQRSGCYIINDEANGRFVIVSADERMYDILGYSDNGCFDVEKAPDGLLDMIDGYNSQYGLLISTPNIATSNVTKSNGKEIGPFIKSQWNQDSPYNLLCPENKKFNTGKKCVTGCVATAMAQIMNNYKYPTKGHGATYRYKMETQGEWISFDYSNLSIDWNLIQNKYSSASTEAQENEVAKLMLACGVSVTMDYGVDTLGQSGTQIWNVPYALINNFSYNPNTVYHWKNFYKNEDWDALIMEELENERPILYCGQGTGGHAFVLDGCNVEGKYHFNFGASGIGDGYYSLDAIVFVDGGLNLHNFTYYQQMVCQIAPQETGTHEDIFYAIEFKCDKEQITLNSSAKFSYSPTCFASSATDDDRVNVQFQGELGIGLFDKDFTFIKSLYSENWNLKTGYGPKYGVSKYITFQSSDFKEGEEYYIAPYARSNNSIIPTRIRTINDESRWYFVTVREGKVFFVKDGFPVPPPVLPISTGDYHITASNQGETESSWNIGVWQDLDDETKYWFSNIDSVVYSAGYTYEMGWNKVYGIANETHTQIRIPVNQVIGKDIKIKNISSAGLDYITIYLREFEGKMYLSEIKDVWGSMDTEAKEVSKYQFTTIAYGKIDKPLPEPDVVMAPRIDVADSSFTLHCGTKGATIYYTITGAIPDNKSSMYDNKPVRLTENCTINAIAYKGENKSDISTFNVNTFKVATPTIDTLCNTITLNCETDGATIYYELGSEAFKQYEQPFDIFQSCIIKVFATKKNHIDSDTIEKSLIYTPEPPIAPTPDYVIIDNNEAGQLSLRVSNDEKQSANRLKISGKINGTDVVFIREMFNRGKLTDLDIEEATIVSGGESYDNVIEAYTKDYIIGKYMFEDCSGMISIVLPANTIMIENNAFSGCRNLQRLDIPASCTSIEDFAIKGCKNLEEISISKSVNKLSGLAIYNCSNLKNIVVCNENTYFKSVDGVLFTKNNSTLLRYPEGRMDVHYEIPNGVNTIGKDAFDYANIETVSIPNSVTAIESSAFENCARLLSVAMPNSITTLGDNAFRGCKQLDNVKLSSEIKSIGSSSFSGCINLRKFYIGAKVEEISPLAFYNCPSLQTFEVNENNTHFVAPSGILYTKDMREVVKCPMALYAEELRIPSGVEVIRAEAFATCKNISSFKLPETLKTIGSCAFENCTMRSISLPNSILTISDAFRGCRVLETFVVPDSVQELHSFLLSGCESLTYLYIPEGIKSIGTWALKCESLSMINSKVKNISEVEVGYDDDHKVYDAFEDIPADCTWRVPIGTSSKYKAQPWWVSTWKIIDPADLNGDEKVDIADAVSILNLIAESKYTEDADINKDNKVDIADFVSILNIMAE